MVTALNIKYQPSESVVAQGKDVRKREKEGFYKKQGGNGSYRMVKPSNVTLNFEVDGVRHSSSIKDLIRDAYSISRVTEKRSMKFLRDVTDGNIKLNYSDETGLTIM